MFSSCLGRCVGEICVGEASDIPRTWKHQRTMQKCTCLFVKNICQKVLFNTDTSEPKMGSTHIILNYQ